MYPFMVKHPFTYFTLIFRSYPKDAQGKHGHKALEWNKSVVNYFHSIKF